jgi:hypothetical protein
VLADVFIMIVLSLTLFFIITSCMRFYFFREGSRWILKLLKSFAVFLGLCLLESLVLYYETADGGYVVQVDVFEYQTLTTFGLLEFSGELYLLSLFDQTLV